MANSCPLRYYGPYRDYLGIRRPVYSVDEIHLKNQVPRHASRMIKEKIKRNMQWNKLVLSHPSTVSLIVTKEKSRETYRPNRGSVIHHVHPPRAS